MKNVALITGAAGGLGAEFSRIHAERGGDLVLVGLNKDKLTTLKKKLEKEHGVSAEVIIQDLSKENAGKKLYDAVKKKGIEIDYLINNAGFGGIGNFHERDWQADRDMIRVNVVAVAELTHYFMKDFVARDSGKILNVSSVAGEVPGPLQAVYYATKAFVTSFSNALTAELEGTQVTVTTLKPGATQTGFGKASGMDKTPAFAKTAKASDVSQAGYDAMLAGKVNVVAGMSLLQRTVLRFTKLLPIKLVMSQIKQMQTKKQ